MKVVHGNCLDVLRGMDANSVDSFVEDPPYGLGFMGKTWDFAAPGPEYFDAQLRVAKPGSHLVAFGGTRVYHRLTCAIEDAGWEIRDCLMWLYGEGFPKSHNVSNGIDKAAGVMGHRGKAIRVATEAPGEQADLERPQGAAAHEPITDAAKEWEGFGTALKPGWEPIILARKPLEGTVAENVQRWGTGALNIDGCRVEGAKPDTTRGAGGQHGITSPRGAQGRIEDDGMGRWPANVILAP